jgi:hypothetical protein
MPADAELIKTIVRTQRMDLPVDWENARDLLVTAAILEFFSFIWFGSAQEFAPPSAVVPRAVGSGIGFVSEAVVGILSSRNRDAPSALDPSSDT